MRVPAILIFSCSLFITLSCKQDPRHTETESALSGKSVEVSGTAGWETDDRFIVSQPSNIINNNGFSYVFYVKEPVNSPIAGSGYGGTIHYAFSRDQGNTWSDQGMLISAGAPDQFDGGGVSKPAAIQVGDDRFYYLYYVGVRVGFTNQDGSPENKTGIGMAKLIFNEDGPIRLAIKLNSAAPVLESSESGSGRFDAFRVDDPNPVNMNGQVWLYYTGLDKWGGTPRTGLAVSANINENHIKQNNVRALLDGSPSLIQRQGQGVIAVFTATQNAWFAPDGLKFIKLKQPFPKQLEKARGNSSQDALTWGLASPQPGNPGFLRWEIK